MLFIDAPKLLFRTVLNNDQGHIIARFGLPKSIYYKSFKVKIQTQACPKCREMRGEKKYRSVISYMSIVLVVIAALTLALSEERYKTKKFVAYDVFGYYSYLPTVFIHQDLNFKYLQTLPEEIQLLHYHGTAENGSKYQFYTFGVALLELPGFLAAMIHAKLANIPIQNGLSPPFPFYIVLITIVWLLIGLLFLRAFLLKHFSDPVVAITLLCLGIGTNLIYYSSHEAGMSHVFSFSLICIFIYLTGAYYERRTVERIILLGITLGIITLIRVPNVLIVSFFFLYGITSIDELTKRTRELLIRWKDVLLILILGAGFIACQVALWYYQTGMLFLNGYNQDIYINVNFEWHTPHIIDGLFSYKKGWLLYTPIMGFSMIGVLLLFYHKRSLALPVAVYTVIVIYVLFSWQNWWYGGSFGMRAMIDSYGLLAIPFACCVGEIIKAGKLIKLTSVVLLLFFIFLNLFQIKQYINGAIHWDRMSKDAYWAVFLKKETPDNFQDLLEPN